MSTNTLNPFRSLPALVAACAVMLAEPLVAAAPTARPQDEGLSAERLERVGELVQRHLDPKEKLVGIALTQTSNREFLRDFENAEQKSAYDVIKHLIAKNRGGPEDSSTNPEHLDDYGQ